MKLTSVHILLVEDNEGDILLTLEAFEESKIKNEISVVRNGQEALDFLYKRGNFLNAKNRPYTFRHQYPNLQWARSITNH
jgi:CheY-like chemotaxis protein